MPKFNAPSPMDFSRAETWPEWKARFGRYHIACKLQEESEEVQINTLIYVMGEEAEGAFRTLNFTTVGDDKKYEKVMEAFDTYFAPKKNIIHERAMFYSRYQRQEESAEAFIRSLYDLAERCDFKALKEEQIRDRIVVGIKDKELSRDLQLESELTLSKAKQMVRNKEQVLSHMTKQTPVVDEANIAEVKPYRKKVVESGSGQNMSDKVSSCGRCGRAHGKYCPASGIECFNCKKVGHFAKFCHAKKKSLHEVSVPDKEEPQEEDGFYLEEISVNVEKSEPWWTKLRINGETTSFKVDPGADVTVMTYRSFKRMKELPCLANTNVGLTDASGNPIKVHGKFQTSAVKNGTKYNFAVYVAETKNNLLSRPVAEAMKMVQFRDIDAVEESKPPPKLSFGRFKGPKIKIELEEGVKPHNVHAPRRVAFPMMKPLKFKLDEMESQGVIVKVTEPTEWCSGIVVQPKKNPADENDIRVCVDHRPLNKAVKRERFILPTFDDISTKMKGCKVFSRIDLKSGYHQLPLDEESSLLTTFITPFGRYRYTRLPFGIACASEIFQRRMYEVLGELDGVAIQQDDVAIGGKDVAEHDIRLDEVMKRLKDIGAELSLHKCIIRASSVEMTGHIFSADGISADPAKVKAITDLVPPENVSELRRVLGMMNWLCSYVPHMATVAEPLNKLLKKDVEWVWGPDQQSAFDQMKEILTSDKVLAFYDPNLETVVAADASSYGLGAVLLQKHENVLKPVAYASKSLTSTERRYAQIEKEMLSLAWSCDKFSRFLIGLPLVKLITDHKPLVPIINSKDLDQVPMRVQKMLMRLMRYTVDATHVPGKTLTVPDTLSRAPLSEENDVCSVEMQHTRICIPASDVMVRKVQEATANDAVLQEAMRLTLDGWPREVPENLSGLFSERYHLSVAQGILLYNQRMVIPECMRMEILKQIHDGHQGVAKCRARAQGTVWWPGISADISDLVSRCEFCQIHRAKQSPEPMISKPLPQKPWEIVGADLCELGGVHYLVIRDYYSRFIEISHLPRIRSVDVVGKMKVIFSRHGVPEEILSDNGPQFVSEEFRHKFQDDYGFEWNSSSPGYQQANGMAETAVKVAKRILRQKDPVKSLMIYNATPISATGYSPAHLLMGRQIRTNLPQRERNYQPEVPPREVVSENHEKARESAEYYYNRGTKALPPLKAGDHVRVMNPQAKHWSYDTTQVIRPCGKDKPRSYMIKPPSGGVLDMRRNRRHLLHIPTPKPGQASNPATPSPGPYTARFPSDTSTQLDSQETGSNPESLIPVSPPPASADPMPPVSPAPTPLSPMQRARSERPLRSRKRPSYLDEYDCS